MSFERKIVHNTYSPKRNEEKNTYERRTNADQKIMFNEPDIIGLFKSTRISWVGHIWRVKGQILRVITM